LYFTFLIAHDNPVSRWVSSCTSDRVAVQVDGQFTSQDEHRCLAVRLQLCMTRNHATRKRRLGFRYRKAQAENRGQENSSNFHSRLHPQRRAEAAVNREAALINI